MKPGLSYAYDTDGSLLRWFALPRDGTGVNGKGAQRHLIQFDVYVSASGRAYTSSMSYPETLEAIDEIEAG